MIIDTHTHIWSTVDQLGREVADRLRRKQARRWGPLDASPAAHESAMECVDAALVFGFRCGRLDACVPNEFIADFVAKDSGRRFGIAGIDPMMDDAMAQLETAHELGMVGVAVSPASQGFHPTHSDAMRVYERCVELAMPIFVSHDTPLTSGAIMDFSRPAAWDEVARSYPDLPIVIGQVGHPWMDETLTLLGKHERVFADISGVASRPWQLYNTLLSANSLDVIDKLLFGSAFPADTPAKTIESLYTVNTFSHGTQLPSVPRSQLRAIVERDSLQLLGIESSMTTAAARTGAASFATATAVTRTTGDSDADD